MNRYFLSFSYLGTHFKASVKTSKEVDTTTVAGTLEIFIQGCKGIKKTSPVYISSRTDAGVHALHNTAHIDIEWYRPGLTNSEILKERLNYALHKSKLPLWVLDVFPVSQNFSARYCAEKRTYKYRFAVETNQSQQTSWGRHQPISEWRRCFFVQSKCFNVDDLQDTLSHFVGTHDFTSFIKSSSDRKPPHIHSLYSCCVSRDSSLLDSSFDAAINNYSFYNVTFEGRSFGYQQIRRMLGMALSVVQGTFTKSDLVHLLNFPASAQHYRIAPAYGLYLTKVLYNPKDFLLSRPKRPHPHQRLVDVINLYKSQLILHQNKK